MDSESNSNVAEASTSKQDLGAPEESVEKKELAQTDRYDSF